MSSDYLPPGVTNRDLPGSRPEDEEIEFSGTFVITKGLVDRMKKCLTDDVYHEYEMLFEQVMEEIDPEWAKPIEEGERYVAEPDDVYGVDLYYVKPDGEIELKGIYDIEPRLEIEVVASLDNSKSKDQRVECYIPEDDRWFMISKHNFKRIFKEA